MSDHRETMCSCAGWCEVHPGLFPCLISDKGRRFSTPPKCRAGLCGFPLPARPARALWGRVAKAPPANTLAGRAAHRSDRYQRVVGMLVWCQYDVSLNPSRQCQNACARCFRCNALLPRLGLKISFGNTSQFSNGARSAYVSDTRTLCMDVVGCFCSGRCCRASARFPLPRAREAYALAISDRFRGEVTGTSLAPPRSSLSLPLDAVFRAGPGRMIVMFLSAITLINHCQWLFRLAAPIVALLFALVPATLAGGPV